MGQYGNGSNGDPSSNGGNNDGPADDGGQADDQHGQAGGHRRERLRIKEADEIKLLSLPEGTAWRAWRANTIHAIVAAAGRHDGSTLDWIMKTDSHDEAYLNVPGSGWVALDRKLAAAISRISHGKLGRTLTLTSNAALGRGQSARGRVLLQILFSHYSSGKNAELMYDINRIQKIHMNGRQPRRFPKQPDDGFG